jgi:hypothetical protein
VDPVDLYRQAAAQLTAAPAMTFHVEKRFDAVLIDGAKVEYSGALDVMVKSTGGLFIDYGDDLSSRRVWYDGKTVTLLDSINNVYASTPASGSVKEALAQVNEKHGLEMPLAPLSSSTTPITDRSTVDPMWFTLLRRSLKSRADRRLPRPL